MFRSKNLEIILILLAVGIIIEALFIFSLFYQNKILQKENISLKQKISILTKEKEKKGLEQLEPLPSNLIYTLFINETGPFASGFVTYPSTKIRLKIVNNSKENTTFESEVLKIPKTKILTGETNEIEILTPEKSGEYEYIIYLNDKSFPGKLVIQ